MIGRAFTWVRDNWYSEVLPVIATLFALHGIGTDKDRDIAVGAFLMGWACWARLNRMERDDAR